ncbi:uncharacterized protein B0P05DRAFT_570871 [Gilbertella persicaria]|uniref:uncharacterized protein n=1 Tax=Gilbertella persicaria TaxID=101096 RepID=UPI00221FB34D|nr:uncharacterized protein B0P05DRAFT_570871 [Gilbertella persicaria]KAI8082651.1 hypothetical protein B0P05DRAFT_570871 [Gilbertella persicaria]
MSFDTTNLLTLNNEPFPTQPQSSSSSSSDQKQISKLILKTALQKANAAVQCDSTNDVMGAISAYKEAITLLGRVLVTVDKQNDKRRLQEIYDSYSERIRLLNSITQRPSNEEHQEAPVRSLNISSTLQETKCSIESSPSHTHAWQDNNAHLSSSTTRLVSQKELTKIPTSPTTPQLQSSKSTPTHLFFEHKPHNDDSDSEEDDECSHHEPMPTMHISIARGRRSSSISSIESALSYESAAVEQPAMTLPSLRKKDEDNTPIPRLKTAFRARTSSLPRPSLMQRSSSMSTVETLGSHVDPSIASSIEEEQEEAIVPEEEYRHPITIDTSQQTISRPGFIRPSISGLGSMRKKAVNRLSMEGFVGRNKDKIASSPSNGSSFSIFLKDPIKPAAESDCMDTNHIAVSYQQPHYEDSMSNQYNGNRRPSSASHQLNGNHLKLLLAIEKSMIEGAHVTQRLYIPKNLWQQPNIRLSSIDIKISACESIINDIARLENWSYLDDLVSSTRLLDHFENSMDQLQNALAKKLKKDSMNAESPNSSNGSVVGSSNASIHSTHSRDSMATIGSKIENNKKTQSFMSWSTKLTKSVERMNAFSLTKTEDQFKNYIEALQKLFLKIHVLEHWLDYYCVEKRKSKQPQHDVLIMKLTKICTIITNLIGGFVVRDITVLLAKWLKRGGSWVNE